MATAIVRVSKAAWHTLKDLSERRGETMQEIVDKALEEYRRKLFLEEANRAFAEIRNNPQAWQEELEERKAWDAAIADGLEEGE
ncbi:MAG: toxin-antitoxin system protein [Clostridia bacterium]|nr:toxin-antitoxin system protein [Clostridia bacterium]